MPSRIPARLITSATRRSFTGSISNTPSLPAIDWTAIGQTAPTLLSSSNSTSLPTADAVVITWAEAEWAAMQHVFCASTSAMPYGARNTSSWSGWTQYSEGLPPEPPSGWSYWGEWRLVGIGGSTVMLFKSNTHLDFPGQTYLAELIQLLIRNVKPTLILSIGTAGGAQTGDAIGTVRASSAGTLYEAGEASTAWPVYSNSWKAKDTVLDQAGFNSLLFPIPTTEADLQGLCTQFNQEYGSSYTLAELNPNNLNSGDAVPVIADQTGGAISLLTTPTFVVGTTSGTYAAYTCIEMDDAVLAQACDSAGIAFGSVRNISDPVQNASLPAEVQGNWGSVIYETYGLYTSYNGALAAWALLAAQL
jgi:hypothetical protein